MRKIGLDTNLIIGMLDEQDVWHTPTVALMTALKARDFEPVVFDCVLSEAISTLARRVHEKRRAVQLSDLIALLKAKFPTKSIVWLSPDLPSLYDDIITLVQQSSGELNFNDALIALSCRNRNIPFLASFDADFDQVDWLKRLSVPADLPD
jgi:predicted nucleic acid-binding protein